MIGIEDAIARVRAAAQPLQVERLPLANARGRVLAEDVVAAMSLPPFDNSAMDGFALRANGSAIAAGSEFAIDGEQAAGDAARTARGEACEIMTGARMPEGFDSVVPVEDVEVLERDPAQRPHRIRIAREVAPGQHLRHAGEDLRAGTTALQAGIVLDPFACMLLDALGVVEVPVRRRPRVAVFATGRELVADPQRPLASGEIRDSNGPYLQARLVEAGAEVVRRATLTDDAPTFVAAVREALALGVDAVISTGAVSMGRYDFVPEALAMLGAETVFHKLRMRPGKPQLFALLPQGALFFGLPGNPISTAVGQRLLVETALRRMLGMPDETRWRLPLAAEMRKKPGNASIQKAALRMHADGRVRVQPLRGQESFRIAPLREANVWALLPEEGERFAAGTLVDVLPPSHMQAALLGSENT
jgi:molybdopterin molybdotransferase